jgi:membrane protease YdiL (CAAX protease family)
VADEHPAEAETPAAPSPWTTLGAVLVPYAVALVAAELLLVLAVLTNDPEYLLLGLLLDVSLVLVLVVHASLVAPKDERLAAFLGALVLAPIVRVASMSTPFLPFTIIQWLAIISLPLLFAALAVMHGQGLRPRDVYLALGARRAVVANVGLGAFGLVLGFVEYQILLPEPWIDTFTPANLLLAGFVVFLATGLAEELIFRGVLLRTGIRLLGVGKALLYITVVFTALHIGFLSPLDLLFVFFAGLFFGLAVLATGSMWGAVAAHTLANVMLYLVMPFV